MNMFSIKASRAKYVGFIFGVLSAATVNASIINTSVNAGMEIRADSIVDATEDASGVTSASVAITGNLTGASAHSTLGFSSLGSESAVFNFDLGYNSGDYVGSGYIGASSGGNAGVINYLAMSDVDMTVGWNFDYTGSNPFGLQIINVSGGPFLSLGNYGILGHHEGNTNFSLSAGNNYLISVNFYPNAQGGIGSLDGTLSGMLAFNFGQTTVPESSGVVLLGLGLIGLGFARRRKAC